MYERHLSPKLIPCLKHVKRVDKMTDRYFSQVVPKIINRIYEKQFDPIEILKNKETFGNGKRMKYYESII